MRLKLPPCSPNISATRMNPASPQRRNLVICIALLIAATLLTYWPALKNEFINYDDPDYVTANEVVKKGLTTEGFRWAFTTGHASNWHPITWLSHMADVSMFGMKPTGHHATNLVFHVANSVLLLLLLWLMTGSVWRSAMVAALFALHPLHVESVAWVAERKDVLSAFFGILTLMAYAHYVQFKIQNEKLKKGTTPHPTLSPDEAERAARLWYGVALGLFALGLMSKPMLVTWPFVMLLLDFWPLGRWRMADGKVWKQLVVEKLPFLLLAVISSAITLAVQQGAMAKTEIVPIGDRFCNAVLACANYLQQTAWPAKLAVFYPFPTSFPAVEFSVAIGVLVAIFILVIRLARSHPFLIVGWLWFVGTLVPVIGLVQVGAQARADRYTYLPLIGVFFALSWGLHWLIMRRLQSKPFGSAIVIAVLIALGITSHRQLQHWQNDRALCSHAANVTTDNYMAWGGLGIIDVKATDWPSAMTNLMRAYEYAKPHHTERSVSYYVGVALQMQGKPKDALPYLETCIVSAEMQPERNHRLGLSLMDAGRMTEAEAAIRSALAAKPQSLDYNLGMAALLMAKGDTNRAEPIYASMVTSHSTQPAAHKSYGDFLSLANRHPEAEPRYATAVKLKPDSTPYRKAYANSLQRNGRLDLAVEQYEKAFALATPTSQELLDLADIYAQLGQTRKVLACYDKAIEQEPNSVPALNNLAWLLATCPDDGIRNGARAVELAERACKITDWKATVLMGTLAAAYAEAGRFPDAIAMAEKAITKARAEKQDDVAKRNGELLELYRSGKPYREK